MPSRYAETTAQWLERHMCKLKNGDPPTPDHEAAHSCGNGKHGCINPNHLRWATDAENMADTVDIDLVRDGASGKFIGLVKAEEPVAAIRAPRPLTRRRGIGAQHEPV